MNATPVQDIFFDDEATLTKGAAFDQACSSLRLYVRDDKVRALIAKLIIEVAKKWRARSDPHAVTSTNGV
jgi:hypothetical protein